MDRRDVLLGGLCGLCTGVGVTAAIHHATKPEVQPLGLATGLPVELKPAAKSGDEPLVIDRAEFEIGRSTGVNGLYLDLIKHSLTDLVYLNDPALWEKRTLGKDDAGRGLTLIGLKRLDNLQFVAEKVLEDKVPGDFIEAGAWRGGATIFMRAVLKAHQITDRTVWVADSFEGLPPPNVEDFPQDEGLNLHLDPLFVVSLENVQNNFRRYSLLDNQVRFLKGWFKDTLPQAPIEQLAVLRIDADLYESTMDALEYLYPKLSPGGYCIIDDYGCFKACKQSVTDYRAKHDITEEIHRIDWTGVYWKKEA